MHINFVYVHEQRARARKTPIRAKAARLKGGGFNLKMGRNKKKGAAFKAAPFRLDQIQDHKPCSILLHVQVMSGIMT